ncbi:MAG: asparagine synthetase B [Chloroflexi bacterium]|nr:asparagine synthetase B [Chloroflexota bacterium]
MSGIAGTLSRENHEIVTKMLRKTRHRGTSKPKVWEGSNAALGAIGLTAIHEKPGPITTPNGESAIVMDGRITNRTSLQGFLEFHTMVEGSDTEVILHAFEERGTRIFGRLEGEFALAIVDGERFLLVRDRLGIRPLYYGFQAGALCFASEIKALAGVVEEIREFPPGHFLISDQGLYPYQPYFPKPIQLDGALESAEQLSDHLRTAVQKAIPEGAEVGVWLSGGVDSSVIAALARPFVDRLYTFSAGIEGAPDLEYARQVAQHIGAEHYEHIYTLDEMRSVLDKTIYHLESFDAPLVHSAVSNYLVSKLASDHVPFVLSGEGGDELFAGYAYQKMYQSEVELTLSVQETIAALHNTALQRVDRSASAHSTGVGMPFLNPDVVRYALAIPARWKIRGPQEMEKWPLRQGLADTLPDEVIWRDKSKFWEGSGSGETLTNFAETAVSDEEFNAERGLGDGDQLRSKEELMYYRIFKQHFGESVPLTEIGRTAHI